MSEYTNSGYTEVDLQNFGDTRIAENGVLEIPRDFTLPVVIVIGRSSLELTRIEMPPSAAQIERDRRASRNTDNSFTNAYILRNISSDSSDAVLTFGENDFDSTFKFGEYIVKNKLSFIIGRETTPELELDPTVSREHLGVRIGNWSQNLHFRDQDTTNGTRIKVEERAIDEPPTRCIVKEESGNIILRAVHEQCWER